MTKVQKTFQLTHSLDETAITQLASANAVYGIEKISVDRSRMNVTVEFDASRLRDAEVESLLQRAGASITPVP